MINEIRISDVATYHSPAVLEDLRAINFIYGANGTGKTTISRVIAQSEGGDCQLSWQGGTELDVMVYNRDFVERNFNQDDPLQGVFTLGENQVEAEQEIASLKPEIEKASSKISSLDAQLNGEDGQSGKCGELAALEPELRDKCWKQKQLHDAYFWVAFSGVRNNAEKFKAKVLAEHSSNDADLYSLDELKEKAETVFSNDVERAVQLEDVESQVLVTAEGNSLLQKVIVGNQDVDIAALIEQLGNSDWVKQGRQYHEQASGVCPFCQQSTDMKFADDLAAFFSEAYDGDIQALKQLQGRYQIASEQLVAAIQRNMELNNPFLDLELFNAEAQALFERVKINQAHLKNKLNEPSRKIELEPVQPLLTQLQDLVAAANVATARHNQVVTNLSTEKQSLTAQIWRYVVNELADELSRYHQKVGQLRRAIQGMEQGLRRQQLRLNELNGQIRELERQTTSIQPTVTAINDLLRKFGFHSFSLGEADSGRHYRILRDNGEDASRSLSEGEKTFITFLYFYSLIKGAQSPAGISTNRVVVFDDPISSLDSDILYIVSSLIKGALEETESRDGQIKQVFVLTHNVYFHKEVTFNKNRHKNHALNEESFWLVKKLQNGSTVERCEVNPVRSAYELLWEDVKSENISSISLQNTLRRILENYFTMWGGMGKDDICALFEGREKLICQSLFSWVNDGSHSIHDDLYINHGEQTNETYLRVFREVFNKARQLEHYRMMTGETVAEEAA